MRIDIIRFGTPFKVSLGGESRGFVHFEHRDISDMRVIDTGTEGVLVHKVVCSFLLFYWFYWATAPVLVG